MQINLHRSMSHHESPSRSNQIHSELTNVNQILPQHLFSHISHGLLKSTVFTVFCKYIYDKEDMLWLQRFKSNFRVLSGCTEFNRIWCLKGGLRFYDLHWATTRVTQALNFFWEPCKNQIEIFDQRRLKRLFNLTFRPRIPHSWNETNKNITTFHNADSKWFQMVRNGSKLGPITRMLSVRWIQWVTSICKTKVKSQER